MERPRSVLGRMKLPDYPAEHVKLEENQETRQSMDIDQFNSQIYARAFNPPDLSRTRNEGWGLGQSEGNYVTFNESIPAKNK